MVFYLTFDPLEMLLDISLEGEIKLIKALFCKNFKGN